MRTIGALSTGVLVLCIQLAQAGGRSHSVEKIEYLPNNKIAVLKTSAFLEDIDCHSESDCISGTDEVTELALYLTHDFKGKHLEPGEPVWMKRESLPTEILADLPYRLKFLDFIAIADGILILYNQGAWICLDVIDYDGNMSHTLEITRQISSLGRFIEDGAILGNGQYIFLDFLVGTEMWKMEPEGPVSVWRAY